jgi:hypothetical protein
MKGVIAVGIGTFLLLLSYGGISVGNAFMGAVVTFLLYGWGYTSMQDRRKR